jgi:hypothetical protein
MSAATPTASKAEVYASVDRALKSLSLRYEGDADKARFRFAIDTGTCCMYAYGWMDGCALCGYLRATHK